MSEPNADRPAADVRQSAGFPRAELLSAAPLWTPHVQRVRFQDIDAAGIVFYPRLLEYFHDAYVVFLRDGGHPLERALAEHRWAAPIAWAEAHFLRPLRFGDEIETALVRLAIDRGDVRVGFRTSTGGQAVAVGTTRAVFVDLASFKRTDPPPELSAFLRRVAGAAAAG